MGKLLDIKFDIDHRLLSMVNAYRTLKAFATDRGLKEPLKRTSDKWTKSDQGACLICGNGPSLSELDLCKLTAAPTFVGNYFYKHKDAARLSPKYYVIIDGKVAEGIWPISMIDEIFAVFPNTQLFLDVRWRDLPLFAPYREDERIYWILPIVFPHAYLGPRKDLHGPVCGLNVVATMISLATAMGYTKLGIAGVDGDGLFREIVDMQSHFYEGDKDHSMRDFESMVKSLMLSTQNLWAWHGLVKVHAAHGVTLKNVCKGGIMDCMPRAEAGEFLGVK